MEIASKVIETDRASIESGQGIEVLVDSKPLKVYKGKSNPWSNLRSRPTTLRPHWTISKRFRLEALRQFSRSTRMAIL